MTLSKPHDPHIDNATPWADADRKRERDGEVLIRLIQSLQNRSYVIGVKSKWGTGKSVFLKRLAAALELETPSIPVVQIDAWRTDYFDDPLFAFVAATDEKMSADRSRSERLGSKAKSILEALVDNAASITAPIATAVGDFVAPGAGTIVGAASGGAVQAVGSIVDKLRKQRSAESDFREKLGEARDFLTDRKTGPLRPIVVCVDELDRCRPDYAIKTLERIKHFFDVPGVIFLIATDGTNLPNAVASVYGEKVDGETYLRKFFDYEYELAEPDTAHFVPLLERHFDFDSLIESSPVGREGLKKKYNAPSNNGYSVAVSEFDRALDAFEVIENFRVMAAGLKLSLRDQGQAFTIINAYMKSAPARAVIYPSILVLIACLRFSSHSTYELLMSGGARLDSAIGADFVKRYPHTDRLLNRTSSGWEVRYFASAAENKDSVQYITNAKRAAWTETNGSYDGRGKVAAIERLEARRAVDSIPMDEVVPRIMRLANAFS